MIANKNLRTRSNSASGDLAYLNCISPKVYAGIKNALARLRVAADYQSEMLTLPAGIEGLTWQEYQAFLSAIGDHHVKHAFADGKLFMMSPLLRHDWFKRLIGRFLETMAYDQDLEIKSIGSTTISNPRAEHSFEADEAYYIANEHLVRGKIELEPDDPPPDLIVEIDVTSSSREQLALYALMKVPEVWLFDGKNLQFLKRSRRTYRPNETSLAFPFLTPEDVLRFVSQYDSVSERLLIKQFVAWARKRRKAFEKEQSS